MKFFSYGDIEGRKVISVVGAGGKTGLIFQMADMLAERGRSVAITTTTHMYHPEHMSKNGTTVLYQFISPENKEKLAGTSRAKQCVITGRTEFQGGHPYKISAPGEECFDLLQNCFDAVLIEADGARHMPVKAYRAHEPAVPSFTDKILVAVGLDGIGKTIEYACFGADEACRILHKEKSKLLTCDDYVRLIIDKNGLVGKLTGDGRLCKDITVVLCQCATAGHRENAEYIAAHCPGVELCLDRAL